MLDICQKEWLDTSKDFFTGAFWFFKNYKVQLNDNATKINELLISYTN